MDNIFYRPRSIDSAVEQHLRAFGAVCIEGATWCGKTWTAQRHSQSAFLVGDPAGNFQTPDGVCVVPFAALKTVISSIGPAVQLERAAAFQAAGGGFESSPDQPDTFLGTSTVRPLIANVLVENRVVGMKSRGVYDPRRRHQGIPAAIILAVGVFSLAAGQELFGACVVS